MEYTQNYQLPLWDKEDAVLRTDFNENNQKIDAALASLALRRNCTLTITSYVGTGEYGAENPTVITFTKRPTLAFVWGYYTLMLLGDNGRNPLAWWSGSSGISQVDHYWDGNTVYIVQGSGAKFQSNEKDVEYLVYAFYQEED